MSYIGNRPVDAVGVRSGGTNPALGMTGELFYNTISSSLSLWNGQAWVNVSGAANVPSGNILPTGGTRGQLFFLNTDQKVYVYTGTAWRPLGGSAYGATLPATGNFGDMFYNTTNATMYVWNGTGWSTLGERGYTGSAGPRGFNGSVGDRGYTGSAGNFGYTPVNKAGDDMTGFLTLNANPVANLHAAPKQYVDQLIAPKFNTPTGTTAQYIRGNGSVANFNAAAIGLGNVNDTPDNAKPVSAPQQEALNNKADLASPMLTGEPRAPTAPVGNNSNRIATTAFVQTALDTGVVRDTRFSGLASTGGIVPGGAWEAPSGYVVTRLSYANGGTAIGASARQPQIYINGDWRPLGSW